jgi:pimeloyl-ACP methyl ester carboxylesterase
VLGLVLVTATPRRKRYRFALAPAALIAAYVAGEIAGGAIFVTHVPRYTIHPVDLGAAYEEVAFETEDGLTLRGWYVPSENGAAVALMHGSGGSRMSVANHARMLIRNGYGVLLFDVRGHGESDGTTIAVGWSATPDPAAAARFLASQPDVDPARIGLLGSSMGAEIAVTAAAEYDGFAAIVADGASGRTYGDFRDAEYSKGTVVMYALAGVPLEWLVAGLSQTASPPPMTELAPRIDEPMLYIASGTATEEETLVTKLWERTRGDAELWVVEGAGHTEGLKKFPEEYEERVVAFFDRYLAAD